MSWSELVGHLRSQSYFQGSSTADRWAGIRVVATARQVHDDKCEEDSDCIVVVYFYGKLDFKPVNMKAQ
jgi:hypothetical protein